MRKPEKYIRKKFHRFIWIIDFISRGDDFHFTVGELAKMLHASEVTIHRDLNDLRAKGIKVHSRKGRVQLFGDISTTNLDAVFYFGSTFKEVYDRVRNRLAYRENKTKQE